MKKFLQALLDGLKFDGGVTYQDQRGVRTSGDLVGRRHVGTVTINGKTYAGNNLSIVGGKTLIDGVDITDLDATPGNVLEIRIEGSVENVTTDKSVTVVNGDVTGNIDARGSVNCNDVKGNVTSGGSVNADNIGGSVSAGGSVNADDIGGDVKAGSSVRADTIHGKVTK